MNEPTLRLLSVRGVPVDARVNDLWLIAWFCLIMTGRFSALVGLAVGLGGLASLAGHILARVVVGRWQGATVERVQLDLTGGQVVWKYHPTALLKEFVTGLAGPGAAVALWGLFELSLPATRISLRDPFSLSQGGILPHLLTANYFLSLVNLTLAVFYLLPYLGQAGGRFGLRLLGSLTGRPRLALRLVTLSSLGVVTFFYYLAFNSRFLPLPLARLDRIYFFLAGTLLLLYLPFAYRETLQKQTRPPALAASPRLSVAQTQAHQAGEAGRQNLAEGKLRQALYYFSLAVATEPDELTYLDYRAHVLAWLGEHRAALADYAVLLERFPGRADLYQARALAYHASGQPDAARADEALARRLDPALSFPGLTHLAALPYDANQ